MFDPIIMMRMSGKFAVSNTGSRWALAKMRLSVKTLNLRQCTPLPVAHHLFSSLMIYEMMVANVLARGLIFGRCWFEVWEGLPSASNLNYSG